MPVNPTPSSYSREVGLLRTLAANIERRPIPSYPITREWLAGEGFGRVREKGAIVLAIRLPGHLAFNELTECMLNRLPAMKRGVDHTRVQDELLDHLESYVSRDPMTIRSQDAEAIVFHFEIWFVGKSASRRVFVPCSISRTPEATFAIGPVAFTHIDRFITSDFYPCEDGEAALDQYGFDSLLRWMREHNADWLARVCVEGCERERAEELAELAVDLTIVGLQLAAPFLDTRTMARLDARRGPPEKRTLSEAGGHHNVGWTRKEPGISIGRGTLPDILNKAAPIFTAVGSVVGSFASGSFRLPTLEQAWCDAAYWFHEALTEPILAISMAKLETSLEVLVRAESSKGSARRIQDVLKAFFGLEPHDKVAPGSPLTARDFAIKVVHDRSRVLHGDWSTLGARGMNRHGMEGFVGSALRSAVVHLKAYADSEGAIDNIDTFLAWVGRLRADPAAAQC